MRWLAILGAFAFAYLALVPGGLVVATFDSACAGPECETSLASDVLLTALYAASLVTVAGTGAMLALYGVRPTVARERWIRRALVLALAAVAATLFVLFALAFPVAAMFTLGIGGMVYGSLRYLNRGDRTGPQDPSANGHGKLNGHPG